jgi:CheY-like chemotaxis protein
VTPGRRVRGILFLDYVKLLRRRGVEAVRPLLQPEDLPYLSQRLDLDGWYPMETFERFGLAILREIVGTEVDVIRLWGRTQIAPMLRRYTDLATPDQPEQALTRFAATLGGLFDFGAVTLASVGRERLEVRVAYGMSQAAEEAATWQTVGFFEELITANGGLAVEGALTAGGFVLTWKQPSQVPEVLVSRPRVLVVDDERLVLAALARLLQPIAEVTAVSSAAEALARLEVEGFHAILSDYQLGPAGDGLTLLAEVQRRWPQTRRILHSGSPPQTVDAALAAGVVEELLLKPAPLDVLRRAVGRPRGPA